MKRDWKELKVHLNNLNSSLKLQSMLDNPDMAWIGPGLIELAIEECDEAKEELRKAVQFLREGKEKFAPNTTNSFVDDFLEKHRELK